MEKIEFQTISVLKEGYEDIYFACNSEEKPLTEETLEKLNILGSFKDFFIIINTERETIRVEESPKNLSKTCKRRSRYKGSYIKGNTARLNFFEILSFSYLVKEVKYKGDIRFLYNDKDNMFYIYDDGYTWNENVWIYHKLHK